MPDQEEKERYLSADDDLEAWSGVLKDSTSILEELGIPYAAIGSIATTVMGYEESCSDIDLLVAPSDAPRAAEALAARGYDSPSSDENWLYKAVKNRVLVDIIFRVGEKNEIEPDEEMFRRSSETDVMGPNVKVIAPEDFLVMQAISNKRDAPDYWFKGLQAAACELDWYYVLKRAKVSPVRVLSLLLYARAEGNDRIPKEVLAELYAAIR